MDLLVELEEFSQRVGDLEETFGLRSFGCFEGRRVERARKAIDTCERYDVDRLPHRIISLVLPTA